MTKFYFHLRDHTDELLDPEGVECVDAHAIATKALSAARDCIAGDAKDGSIDLRYRIDVENAANTIVHSIEFEEAVVIARAA
jgi:hypothetical protein